MTFAFHRLHKGLAIAGIVLFSFALAYAVFADTTGTLLPSSDGAYTQWTPKTGPTHFVMVDESVCNGTTDFVSTDTVGQRDSYGVGLSSVPDGATITAIALTPCASKKHGGVGSSTLNVFYRWNGADSADAGNYALGATPVNLASTIFSGLSLVKASSSVLEIGAVYSAGTRGAVLSRLAAVLTYTPPAPPAPPAAPSNLSAYGSTSTAVYLFWTDNATNEDGFKIERSTSGLEFVQIATQGVNATSYTDSGLAPGTYFYRVRAFNAGGDSAYSNIASSTVQ